MINLSKLISEKEDSQWLPISDLMSGLMVLFLFVAITLMRNAIIERDTIKEVAVTYQEAQVEIYNVLNEEFKKDLEKWNAEIEKNTLNFVFKSPDVLFENGKSDLKDKFKEILDDFFPRYINIIYKYQNSISEVRIEGHTSSVWNNTTDSEQAYFNNMQLSQDRTRSVLRYVFTLEELSSEYEQWIKSNFSAVGLSSSKPIFENGIENEEKSRRVTFRIITNADIKIKQILEK